jgi:pimeloyl-ACP methyl ester carboxylesterase
MKRVEVGDISMAVADAGSGPPLLFLHGFPLDGSMWTVQREAFSDRFRVIVPDLRGFGASDATNGVATMEQLADDVARLLDALGIATPVVLAGLSMGGYVAWQFCRRHRARLRALLLCNTRALPDAAEIARGRLQTAETVLSHGPQVMAEPMLRRLFAPETWQKMPERVDALRRVIHHASPRGVAAALRGMAERPDVTTWLPEIDVPTLLVGGEHDGISPPAEMRDIAARMPRAEYREVPAAGHMAPYERPEAFNSLVADWLAGLPPVAGAPVTVAAPNPSQPGST